MASEFACFLIAVALFSTVNAIKETSLNGMTYIGHFSGVGKLRSFQESDYYVSASAAPWTNADNDCKMLFGPTAGLLAIETQAEQNSLSLMLEGYGLGTYWTSGLYDTSSLVWRWGSNYEIVDFAQWGPGQPLTPNAILRIAILYQNRFSANWVSIQNNQLQRYICEIPGSSETTTTTPTTTMPTTTTPTTTTIQTTDGIDYQTTDGIDYTTTDGIDYQTTDGIDYQTTDGIDYQTTDGIDYTTYDSTTYTNFD